MKNQQGIIPLIVLLAVGAISVSGVTVVASQSAIPGDALYKVKQTTENVRVATAFSKTDKAKVHLAIAEEKVKEIEKLEEKGETDKIAEAAQNLEESQDQALELTQSVKSEGENVDELTRLLEVQSKRGQVVITRISPKITLEPVPTPTPCPSSSPSEDNYQEEEDTSSEEDVDEDWDDYWERKSWEDEDSDVQGVSQLRNSQNSSFGSSGGGSSTFDGGAGSSDIEGGTDGSRDPCDSGEAIAPTSAAPGIEGVSTTGLLQLILNILFQPQK